VYKGQVNGNIYKSDDIGWSIKIPNGWQVTAKDKLESNEQKGKSAVEKVVGGQINVIGFKHLISFQKNPFNSFSSTLQPVKEKYPGEYIENNKNLIKLMFDTYKDQGIKADTSSGTTTIVGLKFQTFELRIYSPEGLILNQIIYSRLINEFDFGISINYTNETDRDVMLKVLKESKFEKKQAYEHK